MGEGSHCPFAPVYVYDPKRPLAAQIPEGVDIANIHMPVRPNDAPGVPYLCSIHGNAQPGERYPLNTNFVSRNHAARHQSDVFVYNGFDFSDYGAVDWQAPRTHYAFLAKANRRAKNLKGCIRIAKRNRHRLEIMGGKGVSLSRYVHYNGMVGGTRKHRLLNTATALLFPVRWHEPMGLAIIEAMYFGCPVFGTPYGSLPELIPEHTGVLSADFEMLADAAAQHDAYDRRAIHQYAVDNFSIEKTAPQYVALYTRILDGETLHTHPPGNPSAAQDGLLAFG